MKLLRDEQLNGISGGAEAKVLIGYDSIINRYTGVAAGGGEHVYNALLNVDALPKLEKQGFTLIETP